jgi:dolichyl-phosphate-mannose--protein O-mannosyl transferase
MSLGFALTWMFERFQSPAFTALKWLFLGVTIGLFVYFYPILSGMAIPPGSFREWMWLETKWI